MLLVDRVQYSEYIPGIVINSTGTTSTRFSTVHKYGKMDCQQTPMNATADCRL